MGQKTLIPKSMNTGLNPASKKGQEATREFLAKGKEATREFSKKGQEATRGFLEKGKKGAMRGVDLRADSSGTSSVARTKRLNQEAAQRAALDAQQKAAAAEAFKAKYPGRAPGTMPGGPSGVPPWTGGGGGYNPALAFRGYPNSFGQALSPTQPVV
jgi:hypothetical protein